MISSYLEIDQFTLPNVGSDTQPSPQSSSLWYKVTGHDAPPRQVLLRNYYANVGLRTDVLQ